MSIQVKILEQHHGVVIGVRFPYDRLLIEEIKNKFSKRKWDPINKQWKIWIQTDKDYDTLCKIFNTSFPQVFTALSIAREKEQASFSQDLKINVPLPDKSLALYPYQEAGIAFIEKYAHGRVLLGDAMGLGKTIQVIGWLNLHKLEKIAPVFIIAPSSVIYNWEKEFKKWSIHQNARIYIPTKATKDLTTEDFLNKDVIIISYDKFTRIYTYKETKINREGIEKKVSRNILKDIKYKTLVLDESHYIKNSKTARTKAVKKFAKTAKYILALTGTPFLNKPKEIFTTLKVLQPDNWEYISFTKRYCQAYQDKWGHWRADGASNLEELNTILRRSVMLRREKTDVIKQLPSKIRTLIAVDGKVNKELSDLNKYFSDLLEEISQLQEEYEEEIQKVIAPVSINSSTPSLFNTINVQKIESLKANTIQKRISAKMQLAFKKITKMRHLTGLAKVEEIVRFVKNILEQEHKVIIFAHHADVIFLLKDELEEYGVLTLTGNLSASARQEVVNNFQEDPYYRIIIASIRAAAEGITLTSASTVVFAELDWTPGKMLQAEDRSHRIGQDKTVFTYWLMLKNSIEEYVANLIFKKLEYFEKGIVGDLNETINFIDLTTLYKKNNTLFKEKGNISNIT